MLFDIDDIPLITRPAQESVRVQLQRKIALKSQQLCLFDFAISKAPALKSQKRAKS